MKILDPSIRLPDKIKKCALGVMAKAPQPGRVKTRLAPPLTLDESAALNICFLRDTFMNISEVSGAVGVVVYTPEGEESAFSRIVPDDFGMLPQRGDGFGERLLAAAEDMLACGFGSCCLIDSDSPTVPHVALQQAVNVLSQPGDRIVLGPTDDGGYYLIGMKRAHAGIFENVSWSTGSVFEQTMERAAELALDVTLLPRWYDVDDAATLERLCDEMFGEVSVADAYAAPYTREFVARLLETEREPALWTASARSSR
jgi:rSAM/selenodomain-associated transferase 1